MTTRARHACVVLSVLALGAAGCGGSGKSAKQQFADDYKTYNVELKKIGTDLGNAVQSAQGKTDAALAGQFTALANRIRASVSKLAALKPPAGFNPAVDQLRGALETGANDVEAIARAAQNHDAKAARTATERLVGDSPAIVSAAATLKTRAGVK